MMVIVRKHELGKYKINTKDGNWMLDVAQLRRVKGMCYVVRDDKGARGSQGMQ